MSDEKKQRPERKLLALRAESFIHVGTGQSTELIDLPFARERHTGYPYIPGSGMKGSFRDACRLKYGIDVAESADGPDGSAEIEDSDVASRVTDVKVVRAIFGDEGAQGAVLFSDARMLALPVRSLDVPFRLVTSVAVLRRFLRDLDFDTGGRALRSVLREHLPSQPEEGEAHVVSGKNTDAHPQNDNAPFYLEEFRFARSAFEEEKKTSLKAFVELLAKFIYPDEESNNDRENLIENIAIIDNSSFAYFARHALHVRMRNALDPRNKTVIRGALWSEESLPPETIMTCLIAERRPERPEFRQFVDDIRWAGCTFQVGGNETVGEGWFRITNMSPVNTSDEPEQMPADDKEMEVA